MRVDLRLRRGAIYLLPLALLLVAVAARVAASDLLERLSLVCFDLYQQVAPREPGDAPIRIVDVDDESLSKIGQWPWPRTLVAQLIDKLRDAGAAVIAFDIDFAEPDPARQRIAPAQARGQAHRQFDDHRAFAMQPTGGDTARQPARGRDEQVGAVEQNVEHTAQLRACCRLRQRLHPDAGRREVGERQVDAVEPAVILAAILQMIEHLQRSAKRVGGGPDGSALFVQIEQLASLNEARRFGCFT